MTKNKKLIKILVIFQICVIVFLTFIQSFNLFVVGARNHTINYTQNFEMVENAYNNGTQSNISSISISMPSPEWNVTQVELNFTDIKLGEEINNVETDASDSKLLDKSPNGYAVQINVTEPTTIFSVEIYANKLTTATANLFIQINGYDTDAPNATVYGSTPLNISTELEWYKQTFTTPIELPQGYYFLVLNGTQMLPSDPGKYNWFYNGDSPNNPNLYVSEYTSGWSAGATGEPFLYKLHQRVSRDYNPEEINMTAVVNGVEHQIDNGSTAGTGNLTVTTLNFNPLNGVLDIPILTNQTIELAFNLSYTISIQNLKLVSGYVDVVEGVDNSWTLTPSIERTTSNYSVELILPSSWNTVKVYRDSSDITGETSKNGDSLLIFNNSIPIDASWKITAKSAQLTTSINLAITSFEPDQQIKFTVTPPTSEGSLEFILIDALDTEEHNETIAINPLKPETTFSYTLSDNPHEGTWKIYVYWYDSTDASVSSADVTVTVPFTIDPQVLFMIIIIIVVGVVLGMSTYTTVKRIKRKRREYRENVFNKYMDALSLNYVIVSDKTSGLDIFEQHYAGKEIDPSMITGFLDAIRTFGIELTDSEERSQTIKLDFKGSKVLMVEYKFFRFILIMTDVPSKIFVHSITNLVKDININYGAKLSKFKGRRDVFTGIGDLIEKNLQTSIIYPLKLVKVEKVKLTTEELSIIKRAKKIMKEKNSEYFFASLLLAERKGFQAHDAENIMKLLDKKVFLPIRM